MVYQSNSSTNIALCFFGILAAAATTQANVSTLPKRYRNANGKVQQQRKSGMVTNGIKTRQEKETRNLVEESLSMPSLDQASFELSSVPMTESRFELSSMPITESRFDLPMSMPITELEFDSSMSIKDRAWPKSGNPPGGVLELLGLVPPRRGRDRFLGRLVVERRGVRARVRPEAEHDRVVHAPPDGTELGVCHLRAKEVCDASGSGREYVHFGSDVRLRANDDDGDGDDDDDERAFRECTVLFASRRTGNGHGRIFFSATIRSRRIDRRTKGGTHRAAMERCRPLARCISSLKVMFPAVGTALSMRLFLSSFLAASSTTWTPPPPPPSVVMSPRGMQVRVSTNPPKCSVCMAPWIGGKQSGRVTTRPDKIFTARLLWRSVAGLAPTVRSSMRNLQVNMK